MSWLGSAAALNSWISWLWSRHSSPFPPVSGIHTQCVKQTSMVRSLRWQPLTEGGSEAPCTGGRSPSSVADVFWTVYVNILRWCLGQIMQALSWCFMFIYIFFQSSSSEAGCFHLYCLIPWLIDLITTTYCVDVPLSTLPLFRSNNPLEWVSTENQQS